MSTPEDRRPPRRSDQAPGDRQQRQRRGPLFPLDDDDIAATTQRRPPSPLGDLVEDIDRALPLRAAPQPARRAAPPAQRGYEPTPPPARREGPPRPVTTRERPAVPRQSLRPPLDELVEGQAAPLRRAHASYDDSASDLLRLEHDLASRGGSGFGGYLAPAPAMSVSHWVWMGMIALASVLILTTLGGGPGATNFSRWGAFLAGGAPAAVSQPALFVGQARPVGDYTLRAPPSVTPQLIDSILASYGSPAVGTGEVWYNLGLEYGIDPAFAVAFFIHESAAGTAQGWAGHKPDGSTTHNVGNIICAGYSTCFGRFRDYPSWDKGIEDWYRLISVEYLDGRGHKTVADIIPVYAPSFENDVHGYVNVVQRLVDQWRAQGAP
ncbi:MAG TPA: glucosaminidase domain-containing protein [Chloroflexaceae bacterium]|mgnify:CR=1 FL=1|nr:glucosaminidase domain-containing protein [Chloroflexaceae bacterium]